MKFKVLKIPPKSFKKAIKEAAELIKKGGVLVCPTDTVYGLVADATNKKAVLKIFKIKKRKSQKFLPLFIKNKNLKMAKKLAEINKEQEKFLKKCWPGKITAVLKRPHSRTSSVRGKKKTKMNYSAPKGRSIPGGASSFGGFHPAEIKLYGVDKKTIALRVPKLKLINELIQKLNRPLTGTSANISGKPASTKIKEVIKQFNNQKYQPDLILDAGNLKSSKSSTIIDFTGQRPKIIRKGSGKIKFNEIPYFSRS